MRHSERGSFNSCPQKFKWEQEKLRKISYSPNASEDRTFGIAIHEALKAHYDGKNEAEVLAVFSSAYPDGKEYKEKAKSHDSGVFALKNYIAYWSAQDDMWEVIGTEIEDKVSFNDEDHDLHIDMLARNKQTKEIWCFDHKTTEKNLGKGFWKKYELDSQVTRYTQWVIEKYGSCGGFIINAIQVGHRERMYKGEPAGYYQKFDRQPFSRNSEQIKFWMDSEKDWQALMAYCQASGAYPKHLGSLCGWCDFYELCMSSDNESVRETLYTTEAIGKDEEVNIIDETL